MDGDLRGPQVSCAGAHESKDSSNPRRPTQAQRLSHCHWRIGRDNAGVANRLPQLPDEVVVFFVGADPKPDDEIAVLLCHRAIVISYSH